MNKDEKKEVIKLVVIDTPRGKVPLADSLESILRAFNKILLQTNDNLDKLVDVLSKFDQKLDKLAQILQYLEKNQAKILELLLEINAKISSTGKRKTETVKKVERKEVHFSKIEKKVEVTPTYILKLSEILREYGYAFIIGDLEKARALAFSYAEKVSRDALEIDALELKKIPDHFEYLEESLSKRVVLLIKKAENLWNRDGNTEELSRLLVFLKDSARRIGLLLIHYERKENLPEIVRNKTVIEIIK